MFRKREEILIYYGNAENFAELHVFFETIFEGGINSKTLGTQQVYIRIVLNFIFFFLNIFSFLFLIFGFLLFRKNTLLEIIVKYYHLNSDMVIVAVLQSIKTPSKNYNGLGSTRILQEDASSSSSSRL